MKKINKFLSILLATILILSLFPVTLAHASDNTVTFSAETDVVSAKAGDIVNVDICMSENSVVAALTLIVNYDNTALKILNVQSKEAFGYEEFNTAYGNNKLAYLTASANPKIVGGTLFTIQFEVLKDGCTEISLSVKELADIDLQPIPSSTQSVKIHNYETEITPPTCTEDGFTTYTCACGDTYVGDYVDETGHSFSDWTTEIEPNCTETGLEKQTCSACGETETNELPAKGHSYNSVVTAPTCTETGFTTHTCACGDSYVTDYVNASGHSYNTVVTAPTCTEAGYTTYTCTVCGDNYVSDYVDALGHDYVDGFCIVCENKQVFWTFDEATGTLTIFGFGDMDNYYDEENDALIERPWEEFCDDIKVVVIDDGITSVGDCAFYTCDSLTSVEIPDSVTIIGLLAFAYCTDLESAIIGNGVTSIGDGAFGCCENLVNVAIGNSVETIGLQAFAFCYNLESIIIPDSVISIGEWVFEDCISLTNITVDDNNQYYSSDEYGVLFNKDKTELIQYPVANERTNYIIPDSVTSIGDYEFYKCTNLTSITIGNGVESIDKRAFEDCTSLTNFIVGDNNHYYSSDEYGVLFNKDKTELIQYPVANGRANYIIPDSVKSIGELAFKNCTYLTSVLIPDGITSIDDYSFDNCTKLTSVSIPKSVTTIGTDAFYNCSNIKDVYYGGTENDWEDIDVGYLSTPLTKATMHYCVFGSCGDNLKWTYDDTTYTLTISGTGDMYDYEYGKLPWEIHKNYIEEVIIGNGVTSISDYAFSSCDSLTSVSIPDGVISIGDSAFSSCGSLTSVTIPDSAASIGEWAFSNCHSLKNVIIPDNVTTIDDYAFAYCENLESVTIPDGVETIGEGAFCCCTSLKTVNIPESVTSIGPMVFALCSSLESITVDNNNQYYSNDEYGVLFNKDKTTLIQYPNGNKEKSYTIPESVTSIGYVAFAGCENLEDVIIPDTVTSIEYSFYICLSLKSITVDSNNKYYSSDEYGALFNKDKTEFIQYPVSNERTSYIIPDGITTIDDYAFYWCENLESISIPDGVTTIGDNTFESCTGLMSVIIPKSVTTIGYDAFYKCDNITDVYYLGTEEDWNGISIDDYNNSLLNATIHYNSTSPHTHIYETVAIPPTCTEQGYTTYTCECGDTYVDNYVDALGHSYTSKITTSATHTTTGVMTFTCECGDTYTEIIERTTEHSYETVVTPPTCTEQGYTTYICECGDTYFENYVKPSHTSKTIIIPATCTIAGMEYDVCEICGDTIGTPTVIPATGHTAGGWEVTLEPTYEADGLKVKKCYVCGEIVEEEIIPMLLKTTVTDENTGVSMEYDENDYDGEVEIVVEETFDGTAFDVVDTLINASQTFIYDITMTVDGEETQPNGSVTIKIPLPSGYDSNRSFVYYVNTETGTVEKMPATYENGYMVFETTHFSYYAVIEEYNYTFLIQPPSRTTIRNKDGIILHAEIEGNAPAGSYVEWTASNSNFDKTVMNDGKSMRVIANNKGNTTFTATLYDVNGNVLATDTVELYSQSGFFDKIVGFFRSLFGMTMVYEK